MHVRRYIKSDAAATAQLYFNSVRHGTRGHYDAAQRKAWAPQIPNLSEWHDRLERQTAFVCENDRHIVGFMTLTTAGQIDLAYVAPKSIGQGVAKSLYDVILSDASARGLARMSVDASHLARTFFERQGWTVIKPQTVVRDGISLTNFAMEINL